MMLLRSAISEAAGMEKGTSSTAYLQTGNDTSNQVYKYFNKCAFIHSTNIYWVSNTCQTFCYMGLAKNELTCGLCT